MSDHVVIGDMVWTVVAEMGTVADENTIDPEFFPIAVMCTPSRRNRLTGAALAEARHADSVATETYLQAHAEKCGFAMGDLM